MTYGKKVMMWLLLGIALLSAGGCQDREPPAAAGSAKEPLVIWSYYETDAQMAALDELVAGFNLHQNDYEARWEYVPMTEFTKRLSMAYTEKALPDLAIIDNPDMPACIKMGMFEEITDFLTELSVPQNYYPALLETTSYDGRMYGLPFNCNNVALIYNRQMLAELNLSPPQTWDQLAQCAAVLSAEGRSGFLMSCLEGEQSAFQMLPWILSTDEAPDQIGGEKTTLAFAFIRQLVEQGSMPANCINLSQTDVARVFIQGEAAMMENGPWVLPMLEEAGVDYAVSPLPVLNSRGVVVGGENLGILKGKNRQGALAFLRYYDQDEVMMRFCRKTSVLPTKTALSFPEHSNNQVFKEQMDYAVVRTSIPGWNVLSKQISQAVYDVVSGEKTPEQAVSMLKTE